MGCKGIVQAFKNEQLWQSDHPYCEAAGVLLSEQIPTEECLNQDTTEDHPSFISTVWPDFISQS